MANLQIKGVDEDFYQDLKRMAAAGHRSVSRTVLAAIGEYLAKQVAVEKTRAPGEVLLSLSGSWEDDRPAEEIAADIRPRIQSCSGAGSGAFLPDTCGGHFHSCYFRQSQGQNGSGGDNARRF